MDWQASARMSQIADVARCTSQHAQQEYMLTLSVTLIFVTFVMTPSD
jgi:hypothetical protein